MSERPGGKSEIQNPKSEMDPNLEPSTALLAEFIRLAKADNSGLVRLALASTLQRLPLAQRAGLAEALLGRKEDANDHNLPLLIWYGLIPVAEAAPAVLAALAAKAELPLTRKLIARRLAEDIEKSPGPLNDLLKLSATKSAAFQADILNGMTDGLIGWRKAAKPARVTKARAAPKSKRRPARKPSAAAAAKA